MSTHHVPCAPSSSASPWQEDRTRRFYDACASLGRDIAQRGGSPTLASATVDHAGDALGVERAAWLAPGRAALAEAFTRELLERANQDALSGWQFPRCAVAMPGGVLAVAAGFPSDDPELLREWAAGIAKAAALQGIRQAFVSGPAPSRAAVEEAFDVVGIQVSRDRPMKGDGLPRRKDAKD